jgi:quercetin dioxygenase-like cupin family protein
MDVLVDWQNIPWDNRGGEPRPGYRSKTCVRDGQKIRLAEFSEGFVEDDWCMEGHLLYVLAGESILRLRVGGEAVRLRPGVTGILLAGEAHAHRPEPAAGECVQVLLFEQP